MNNYNKILLASGSTYRQKILQKLSLDFETASPQVKEQAMTGESARNLALRLCREKAFALKQKFPEHYVIASDQVAILDSTQLHKPGNKENCVKQLTMSSGKKVDFYTSVGVLESNSGRFVSDIDHSYVTFKQLSHQQINNYIEIEQPFDCAGSFKVEGLGIALFKSINTDDPNAIIGLPLIKLIDLLAEFDIHVI